MNIKQIRETYTILDILGKPAKRLSSGYLYHAPWREDRNPSLSVTLDGKRWHDFATDETGNIVNLLIKVMGTEDFREICARFDKEAPSFPRSYAQQHREDNRKEVVNKYVRFELHELRQSSLINYLDKGRGINADIARMMGCKEAHYSFRADLPTDLVAIAYPNDLGGYELRGAPYHGNTKGYKGGKAPKGITTHFLSKDASTVVFEGFVDMLSFIQSLGGIKHNYIVLNSTVCADAAIKYLQSHPSPKVFLCFDNDTSGDYATKKILAAYPTAIDLRPRFAPYNDINDWLLATHKSL